LKLCPPNLNYFNINFLHHTLVNNKYLFLQKNNAKVHLSTIQNKNENQYPRSVNFKLKTMSIFLYGANVKAIQQFIFQTSELQEIIGASEIVEEICTTLFEAELTNNKIKKGNYKKIVSAAGIIKYIFYNEDDCRKIVRIFPKTVYSKASGISFSQAVVKTKNDEPTNEESSLLEKHLRIQRNKVIPPTETGLRIIKRSPRTGMPGIIFMKNEVIDKATQLKMKAFSKSSKLKDEFNKGNAIKYNFPIIIDKIASKGNYVAIIHAV
jgi:hypothetical protein